MSDIEFIIQGNNILDVSIDPAPSINVDIEQTELIFNMLNAGPQGPQGPPGGVSDQAEDVIYNNTASDLTAINVQDALDEIDTDFVRKLELSTDGGVIVNGGLW